MKFSYFYFVGVAAIVTLTGCIDDKYDLSDIDTTSEFKIKDLVIPMNMDALTLDDVITTDDEDQLKKVTINGKTIFAVEESGTFESDDINVNKFSAESKPMNPNHAIFDLSEGMSVKGRRAGSTKRVYAIEDRVFEPLEYDAPDVDPSIRSLKYLYFTDRDEKDLSLTITLDASTLGDKVGSYIENLVISLPDGLSVVNAIADGYTYSPSLYNQSSGELKVGRVNVVDGKAQVKILANGIDFSSYKNPIVYDETEDVSRFVLTSEFSIEKGCSLVIEGSDDDLAGLPSVLDFEVTYQVEDILANAIMGDIYYRLEGTGLQIDPIELNDLPDFLADEETNLILANPQIYLSLDNPVGEFGLGYQSGLNIIATREDDPEGKKYPLDNDMEVPGQTGNFNFVLAPYPNKIPDNEILPEYAENIQKLTYSGLGYILSGAGLPNKLDIELVNPMIPKKMTTKPFNLGVNITGMKGNYEFLAPLALTGDSKIIYTKTEDGWGSEDLDALTIELLSITTIATSTVPLDAEVAVYPIDTDGRRIPDVEVVPMILPANAQDYPLTFEIKGTIKNLDGVFITATVRPDGSSETLTPDQQISLKNIRAKVTGNYTKKF